jgi:predicted GNAT family N-acyltransferase
MVNGERFTVNDSKYLITKSFYYEPFTVNRMFQNHFPNKMSVYSPKTPQEWEAYFDLRFKVLREPWQQAKGSEVLQDEDQSDHAMLTDPETGKVLGVARLQTNTPTQGQVRCVAVSPEAQGKGVGKQLMSYLEDIAQQKGMTEIILDARENAVQFYLSIGYEIYADSYLLFGQIPHFKMRKRF